MKKFWVLFLGVTLVGCQTNIPTTPSLEIDKDDLANAEFNQSVNIKFDPMTTHFETDSLVNITCNGDHITLSVSDSTVTGLKVILTGHSDDASLKIYGNVPVLMEFNNVRLSSTRGAVINCQNKKRLWLTYSGENHLTDATKYQTIEGEDCKGAIFSEGQIILCGDLSPKFEIKARGGHGIASDDYIRVMGGQWNINSAKDGLHANDYIRMNDGIVEIEAGSDGIDCKEGSVELLGGELEIRCMDDGISANRPKEKKNKKNTKADSTTIVTTPQKKVRANVVVNMNEKYSNVKIRTTGPKGSGIKADDDIVISSAVDIEVSGDASKCLNAGKCVLIESTAIEGARLVASGNVLFDKKKNDTSSPKGIKADSLVRISGGDIYVEAINAGEGIESKRLILIEGGSVRVKAKDDALNAGEALEINAGEMVFYSLLNDGVDSNGTIEINGGEVTAYGAGIPEAGFDCDLNRFAINGGEIMGVGGLTSTPTDSVSTQPSVIIQNVELPTTMAIGYDGGALREPTDTLICVPTSKYGTMLLSNPEMKVGEKYKYECNDSTYIAIPALGHRPLMPPPPPAGVHPHDGKMPPPPHDGKMPPPPPGGFPEGTPPPPPALPKMQAQ
ncbi:MAG: carbohydrate-binding domain-containing protein [Rikenellaceae bacterium]|nr:carbohydrate-binding domain-containing protein [Rikenellaceae bacterium]